MAFAVNPPVSNQLNFEPSKNKDMKTLHTEIVIDAPKSKIWSVLSDTQSFPSWNPFIKSVKGELVKGEQIEVEIQSGEDNVMTFKPQLLEVDINNELRWLGHLIFKGLFDGEHYFILEEINSQQTRLIHGERFRGILVSLIMSKIGESTRTGFMAMNQALKSRVENS